MTFSGADFTFFDDDSESQGEHLPGSKRPYDIESPALLAKTLKQQKLLSCSTTSRGPVCAEVSPQTSDCRYEYSTSQNKKLKSKSAKGEIAGLEALTETKHYKAHECVNEKVLVWRRETDRAVAKQHRLSAHMCTRAESPNVAKKATRRSKVLKFLRRPSKKSKKERNTLPVVENEKIDAVPTPRVHTVPEPEKEVEFSARASTASPPPRPSTSAPSSATKDKVLSRATSRTSRKSKFVEATESNQPALTEIPEASQPYIPKHAAADFSAMKIAPNTNSGSTPSSIQHSASSSTCEPVTEEFEPSSDYQLFLAQARHDAAQPRAFHNHGNFIPPNPPNQFELVHENQLRRAKSTPRRQKSQRFAKVGEKVGEYVRPTAIQRNDSTGDKPGLGFSAMKRSLSTKRKESGRPRGASDGTRVSERNPSAVAGNEKKVWMGY